MPALPLSQYILVDVDRPRFPANLDKIRELFDFQPELVMSDTRKKKDVSNAPDA